MNIQLSETDELSQEDGVAKNIILTIDGKRMIVPMDKPLRWLVELAEKLNQAPVVLDRNRLLEPLDIRPGDTSARNVSTQIQRNDTVKFLGFPQEDGSKIGDESGDLVVDGLYKVIEVNKDTVAIINPSSDFPIRLTVKKTDLVLTEKGERVTQKRSVFEVIKSCPCGQPIALELRDTVYQGTCASCKEPMTLQRAEALKA